MPADTFKCFKPQTFVLGLQILDNSYGANGTSTTVHRYVINITYARRRYTCCMPISWCKSCWFFELPYSFAGQDITRFSHKWKVRPRSNRIKSREKDSKAPRSLLEKHSVFTQAQLGQAKPVWPKQGSRTKVP